MLIQQMIYVIIEIGHIALPNFTAIWRRYGEAMKKITFYLIESDIKISMLPCKFKSRHEAHAEHRFCHWEMSKQSFMLRLMAKWSLYRFIPAWSGGYIMPSISGTICIFTGIRKIISLKSHDAIAFRFNGKASAAQDYCYSKQKPAFDDSGGVGQEYLLAEGDEASVNDEKIIVETRESAAEECQRKRIWWCNICSSCRLNNDIANAAMKISIRKYFTKKVSRNGRYLMVMAGKLSSSVSLLIWRTLAFGRFFRQKYLSLHDIIRHLLMRMTGHY